MSGVAALLVGFGRALRDAGVGADPARLRATAAALGHLDVLDPADVYWAGRLTLCAGPDDLPRYDRCFAEYFGGRPPGRPGSASRRRAVPRPAAVPGRPGESRERAVPAPADVTEVLRRGDLARLDAAERAEAYRLIALLRTTVPRRRSRRYAPARAGVPDPHRTVREVLRRGGEASPLRRRAPRPRPRRVVVLVDVSGSMRPYAGALLRFAYAAVRSGGRTTEAFSMGTRLTRLTRELRHRDPAAALPAATALIPDWSGGTRLGEEIKEFLDRFGRRGMARGAVVVVASDGWERGDARPLGEQMARLHRLAHRVVWVNPHRARPGYEPLAAGMAAALPHVDDFVAGHSVEALTGLARLIGESARRGGEGSGHA
ncbi:hypothetical protein DPM19_21200 [Actinomadura craniellae]|uniref:VWFA domain-containing protein n=1 Tax=Actinomadura craniellae TaxID=2231787 RepID=A0A365H1R8_9ACTN|nr:VWA domain-containing protein [Actinomadura craniellae]RAY13027.1 hypothetical protein DPM19_21200 [Actinomadura craniellae]